MASCASSPRVLCCRYMADKTALAEEAKEGLGIRVLVALDDEHRAYREVIAAGIEVLRPSVKAATTRPEELEQEVARLNPQMVICSQPEAASLAPVRAWVKVPLEPSRPIEVRLDGHRWTRSASNLAALLQIIDKVEETKSPTVKTKAPSKAP